MNKVEKIIKHLEDKSKKYKESFEKILSSGAEWDENTPDYLFWFGRVIVISENGEVEEL